MLFDKSQIKIFDPPVTIHLRVAETPTTCQRVTYTTQTCSRSTLNRGNVMYGGDSR